MAERGVFFSKDTYPFFEEVSVSFPWFGGHSQAQKQRNVLSLTMNFRASYPERNLCEISSCSTDRLGRDLSAMALSKRLSDGCVVVMESAFQSSRIYDDPQSGFHAGPFPQYLNLPGRDAKREVKQASQGLHSVSYAFDGLTFCAPSFHISLFYDFLYLNSLTEPENADVAERLRSSGYDTFSDLAARSLNSQARSCAIYIGLYRSGLLDQVTDHESFLRLFRVDMNRPDFAAPGAFENVQLLNGRNGVVPLRPAVMQKVNAEQVKQEYLRLTAASDPAC